jgi:hypothetical protein
VDEEVVVLPWVLVEAAGFSYVFVLPDISVDLVAVDD